MHSVNVFYNSMKRITQMTDSDIVRFKAKYLSNKKDICWQWVGATYPPNNRGIFSLRGAKYQAPRIAFYLKGFKDPYPLCVLHKCDNANCVNPNHLFLGTQIENMKDRDRKGRNRHGILRGSESKIAKLNEKKVLKIRRTLATGKYTYRDVARQFSISISTIASIATRRNWTHI